MTNGKAYMIVRRPVNAGVEPHLLADPAVCCRNAVASMLTILVMFFRRSCQNALIDNDPSACRGVLELC